MRKSAMITECWTPQSNHRDTFFSIYLFILFLFSSHQRQQIVTGLYQPTPEESRWEDSEDEDEDDEEDDKKPLQDKPQTQDGKK